MLLSLSSFVDLFKYAAQVDNAMINIGAALAACKYRDMRAKRSAGLFTNTSSNLPS
jgi:hypothetical protein